MSFLQDIRHGVRTLRRVPGLVAIAVITLALGIGANTAIFSVIYSVLLKPLVFPESDRIVQTWMSFPVRGTNQASWSHGHFWDAHDLVQAYDAFAAIEFGSVNLTGRGDPAKLDAVRVNADFFRVLGVAPVAGRVLRRGEDEPGQDANVAILSHRLWTRRFGQDPGIVGRTLVLDGIGHQVIGVMPAGTPFLDWTDVFRPLVRVANGQRGSWELNGVARLKPGVTLEAARRDLERVMKTLGERHADTSSGMSGTIAPLGELVAGDNTRRGLWVLLGSVGCLLLIACVNLTNLLLAKAAGRTREIAIRAALGASRRRIVRLLVAESVLLSVAGAAVGLLLSFWLLDLLRVSEAWGIARLEEVAINGWILAFTSVVALATGIATGVMPALNASKSDLVPALREGERGVAGTPRQRRLRGVLVVAEVALTLMLLVAAGLLLRSFSALLSVDRGFQTERRMLVETTLPLSYGEDDGKRGAQFVLDFERALRNLPGVTSAAMVSERPMSPGSTGMGIVAAERPEATREIPWASWRLVTRDYFTTMGIPLRKGRTFTETDIIGKPFRIIISQRLADQLWPGENPLGRQALLWKGQGNEPAEVIGVVGNMRERSLSEPPTLAVYLPIYGVGMRRMYFAIHTSVSSEALTPVLRTALARLDPQLPLGNINTLDEIVTQSTAPRRFTVMLLSAFAALALLLALVGIYGVMSYAVSRQTAEIGVRMALGASRASVLGLVLRQGMKPVLIGVVLGVAAALVLSRLIEALLFGVTSRDPFTYIAVAGLLTATGVFACLVPARQALRVDVVSALKAE